MINPTRSETVMRLAGSPGRLDVPKREKHFYRQQITTREHITVHMAVSAAGAHVPPFLIYPAFQAFSVPWMDQRTAYTGIVRRAI